MVNVVYPLNLDLCQLDSMKTAFILGLVAIVVNIFLVHYLKRKRKSIGENTLPEQFKHRVKSSKQNMPEDEVLSLLEQSASELGIPAEELLHMSASQIKQLAMEKSQTTKIEIYQKNIAAINDIQKDRQSEERKNSED